MELDDPDSIPRARPLLALILNRDPSFGTAAAVLAKIHTPNAPGPGQRTP